MKPGTLFEITRDTWFDVNVEDETTTQVCWCPEGTYVLYIGAETIKCRSKGTFVWDIVAQTTRYKPNQYKNTARNYLAFLNPEGTKIYRDLKSTTKFFKEIKTR